MQNISKTIQFGNVRFVLTIFRSEKGRPGVWKSSWPKMIERLRNTLHQHWLARPRHRPGPRRAMKLLGGVLELTAPSSTFSGYLSSVQPLEGFYIDHVAPLAAPDRECGAGYPVDFSGSTPSGGDPMQFMSRHQCQYDSEPSYDSGQYGKDYGEEYKPPGLYFSAGPEAAHRFNEGTPTAHRGLGFRGQFFVCQVPPRFLLLHGAISPGTGVRKRRLSVNTNKCREIQ
jgi:hypothetical protein